MVHKMRQKSFLENVGTKKKSQRWPLWGGKWDKKGENGQITTILQ